MQIQKLNKKYRKKDKPTDVISLEKTKGFRGDFSEVVICPKFVKEKSKGLNIKKELTRALIHGVLHAIGYDHEISKVEEEKMFKKQNYYLSNI